MGQVASIISNLAARFSTQDQIDKLDTFYKANAAHFGTSQTIPNAIIDAAFNLNWAKQHVPAIVVYLNANSSATIHISFIVLAISSLLFMIQNYI